MGQRPLSFRAMFDGAVREASGGVLIDVDVRPRAQTTRIVGYHEGRRAIRVDLAAKPERGEANRDLLAFLGRLVGGACSITRGASHRHKTILVEGVTRDDTLAALARGAR